MTVNTVARVVDYVGNGSTTGPRPIPFRFLTNSELRVVRSNPATGVESVLAIGVDYTVTGAGDDDGGELFETVATASGHRLRIAGATVRNQPMDYTANDTFPAESHERALDRDMLCIQEIGAEAADVRARSILVPIGEAGATLPGAAQRLGKAIGFSPLTGALMLFAPLGTGADVLMATLATSAGASLVGTPGGNLQSVLDALGQPVFENVRIVSNRAEAVLLSPGIEVDAIQTTGYYEPQDGGGAVYKRVAAEPAHAGKLQTANNVWWELAGQHANVRQFGAKGDLNLETNAGTDDAPAFNALVDFARRKRSQAVPVNGAAPSFIAGVPNGAYKLNSGCPKISNPGGIVWLGESHGAVLGINHDGTQFDYDPDDCPALATWTGNGTVTVYSFTLPFEHRPQDLWVYVAGSRVTTGFTTTISGQTATITFASAPANGAAIAARIAPYDVFNSGLVNLTPMHIGTRTAAALVCRFGTANKPILQNLNPRNVVRMAQFGDAAAGRFCTGPLISDVVGSARNLANCDFWDVQRGAGLYMSGRNDVFNVADLPDQSSGALRSDNPWTGSNPPAAGRTYIRMGKGAWDTVIGNGTCLRFDQALNLDVAPGAVVINQHWDRVVWDYCRTRAININIPASGICGSLRFITPYLVGWDDQASRVSGAGQSWDIEFYYPKVAGAGTNGFQVSGTGLDGFTMVGARIFGAGRKSSATSSCSVFVFGGVKNVRIQDNVTKTEPAVGGNLFTWKPAFGFYLDGDVVEDISVTGNNLQGTTRNYEIIAPTSAVYKRRISGNLNANYAGYKDATDAVHGAHWTKPANGAVWTNKLGMTVELQLEVTLAGVLLKNGQTLINMTGAHHRTMRLQPGDTFAADYSAMTTRFYVEP